jgi:endogenous inhibitor of DNA gyrase (YacG/DUF329 family)
VKQVKCPTCGQFAAWSEHNVFRPFCSERCKLIDLGAWATDSYAIAGRTEEDGDSAAEPARRD